MTVGEISMNFVEQLKQRQAEREAQEKAEREALSETEKQAVIEGRERIRLELEKKEKDIQRKIQTDGWERRGITKRYFNAEWDNWIADTPEKIKAFKNAKTAWKNNLFFTGGNGTGKTHLAMCLAKDGATYRRLPDIFREVRMDFKSEEEIIEYYGESDLLVIDEIGRQKFSDFELNLFFEIIDRRWNNMLPTTIITNLTVYEFGEYYSLAILDRLRPVVINFDWESMRGKV
jgi:DNA replication protein DnaC